VTSVKRIGGVLCAAAVIAAIVGGCGEEQPVEVNTIDGGIEEPAPPEPPSKEQAAQIVAKVTQVPAEGVEIIDQAAAGDVLTIEATIPASEKMLPRGAAAPETATDVGGEQQVEWVTMRWNTATERPNDITWSERLQFADKEPISEDEALQTAQGLKDEWFPQVPAGMKMQPPHLLHRPVWAIVWRGETDDGVLTGDQVAVQVSSMTGLPIAYSQRVAQQRPSADEIEAAREALAARTDEDVSGIPLVARLVLSAPEHPDGGPAWLVRGTGDRAGLLIPVDAMTGDVITGGGSSDGE